MRPTFLRSGAILLPYRLGVSRSLIYGDLVVMLNFLVDFLLLLGTNRLSGFPLSPGRSAAAAGLGSVYAASCLVPGFRFLAGNLWRLVSLAGMAAVAFGLSRSAVRRGGVFVLLSLALGGIACQMPGLRFGTLVLASAGLWLLCRAVLGEGRLGQEYVPVTLCRENRRVTLTALVDSGNTLRDPVTGEGVLVISPGAANRLTGLTREQLADPLTTLTQRPVSGLRLIPYRAVGQDGGMLLAMRIPQATVGSRRGSALVAFAPEGLGEGKEYQALIGGAL